MMFGDIGAQIRYLAAVGHAYVQLGSYDDALGYFDKALKIAAANPDAGYQFVVNEGRLQAFRGMGKLDAAEQLANESSPKPKLGRNTSRKRKPLITAGTIETAKGDDAKAMENFERAIQLAQKGHFTRLLADAQFYLEDIIARRATYRSGIIGRSRSRFPQNSGDLYLLPLRLQALAQLQASQGKYADAPKRMTERPISWTL